MKKLLLTTAILGASALSASAQDMFRGAADPAEIRASELMGMRVYASEATVDADEYEGLQQGWEDIGEVNDLVLGRDGSVEAVLVDVGGFLGLGERQVALSMGSLRFVSDSATADDLDDYFLVVNATRADLEAAPDYGALTNVEAAAAGAAAGTAAATAVTADAAAASTDAAATETEMEADATADMAATDEAMATDEMATDEMAATDEATAAATTEATGTEMAADARAPIAREGFTAAPADFLTADNLQGAGVYDSNDERIGEISELLIDEGGQITDVIVDVGGFLGIGEKPVAMPMGSIDILRQDEGAEVRVYLSQTREELEAMPNYEG